MFEPAAVVVEFDNIVVEYGARYVVNFHFAAVDFAALVITVIAVSYTHLDVYKRQHLQPPIIN